jgi:hypothetical protein
MKNRLAAILIGLMVLGCKKQVVTQVKVYEDDLKDTAGYFFPVYQLADTIDKMRNPEDTGFINEFPKHVSGYISHQRNKWYSQYLTAMKAEMLKGSGKEAIRFTWLRSFDKPISVSLFKMGDSAFLEKTILTGQGGFDPGQIELMDTVVLSTTVWENIQNDLKAMDFWSMPTKTKTIGTDGARWILEVSDKQTYKFVDRWSPQKGPYFDLCRSILQHARIQEKDIY